ncbi:hypothetical protein FCU94_05800 [Vibrio sp. JPW-9-11-11]|nr:hypothetical protein [Vibrio sp. JPW-9-11-11]
MKALVSVCLASVVLAGCSSADAERQRHLSMLAESRAKLLAAELPIEAGPLSILRANANQTTIEIMMVYNQDAKGAKPIKQVLNRSIRSYCTSPETQRNLDVGLSYRVKMRNSRGQLMADELITKTRCTQLN